MTTELEARAAVRIATDAVWQAINDKADEVAAQTGMVPAAVFSGLMDHLAARMRTGPSVLDNRAAFWRIRVRLFKAATDKECEADSDEGLDGRAPGETVVRGLANVAEHLGALANAFHEGQPVTGLDIETLTHRLKSLRPTLSRHGGDAVWRVPYSAGGIEWLARVDVVREKIKD